jgi:hypothetical protein
MTITQNVSFSDLKKSWPGIGPKGRFPPLK